MNIAVNAFKQIITTCLNSILVIRELIGMILEYQNRIKAYQAQLKEKEGTIHQLQSTVYHIHSNSATTQNPTAITLTTATTDTRVPVINDINKRIHFFKKTFDDNKELHASYSMIGYYQKHQTNLAIRKRKKGISKSFYDSSFLNPKHEKMNKVGYVGRCMFINQMQINPKLAKKNN